MKIKKHGIYENSKIDMNVEYLKELFPRHTTEQLRKVIEKVCHKRTSSYLGFSFSEYKKLDTRVASNVGISVIRDLNIKNNLEINLQYS